MFNDFLRHVWAHEINHIVLNGGGHLYDVEQDTLNLMYFEFVPKYMSGQMRYRKLNFTENGRDTTYSQWKKINSAVRTVYSPLSSHSLIY